MNREEFAKKVVHAERENLDEDGVELTSVFKVNRATQITKALLEQNKTALDDIKRQHERILFRETFGKDREEFYRLLTELYHLLPSYPGKAFYDTIEKLKMMVD